MALLRFLLILFISYYAFKLIVRYVLPFFLKRHINKFQQQFYNQNPHLDPEEAKRREGEIKIKSKKDKNSKSSEIDGDYVDYEEVK